MASNGPSNGTGSNGPLNSQTSSNPSIQPMSGPPISDLLTHLEDYKSTIPDAVTQHFLSTAGVNTDDPRLVKLVSVAAQKFVSDVANDALQHCKMRGGGQVNKKSKEKKFTMTTEDLSLALQEQGVTLKKPPYYV